MNDSSSTEAGGVTADGGGVRARGGDGGGHGGNAGPAGGEVEVGGGAGSAYLELPHYIRVNATFFCGVVFVVGVFGNLLVPLVIWRNKEMRNSTNLFLVNLSVADLLVLLVCMPTVIVEIHSAQPESWVLGQGMCKAVPFLELTMAHGSVLTILAISFERYYAICKPLTASYKLTQVRGCVIIVLVWLVAGLATGPVLAIVEYTWRDYMDGSVVPVCIMEVRSLWRKVYFITVIAVLFFLPLAVLVIVYTVIARHLMVAPPCVAGGANARLANDTCASVMVNNTNMRARRQVVTMLAAVVVFFFVCLLPFRVFTLWIIFSSEEDIEGVGVEAYYNVLFFCRTMFYINSAVNPILYNVMSSKFREAFLHVLGCLFRHQTDSGKRPRRKKLDRQTTFNTTYTSLTSSIKGQAVATTAVVGTTGTNNTVTCTSATNTATEVSSTTMPSNGQNLVRQDSAV